MASCANPTLSTANASSRSNQSRSSSSPRRFAGRSKGKRRSTTRPLILDNVFCDLSTAQNGIVSLSDKAVDKLFKKGPIENYYSVDQAPFASGLFATVHQCRCRNTGELFAAKYAAKVRYGADCTADILHEVALMALCSTAPRIVHLRDVFDTPTHTILVMDYAPGGDLQTVLDDDMVPYEKDAVKFIRQLLEGLVFLHDKNIAHLDIKPQNLLLLGPFPDCDIQLCDLEISRVILENQEVREILGTPDYVSPEILQFEPISLAADVWSVGVMSYVLLTGFTPFGGDTDKETFHNICHGKIDFPPELFEDISHHAEDFIRRLLVRQPSARPTVRECLKHPWLASWKNQQASHQRDTISSESQRKSHATNNGYTCPRSLTSLGTNGYSPSSTMPHALQRSMSKSREVLYEKVAASNLRKSTSKSRERLWEMTFTLSRSKDFLLNNSPTPSKSRERLHDLRNLSKSQEVLSLKLFSDYNPLFRVLSPNIPLTHALDCFDPPAVSEAQQPKTVIESSVTAPEPLPATTASSEAKAESHAEDTCSSTETLCAVPLTEAEERKDAKPDQFPDTPPAFVRPEPDQNTNVPPSPPPQPLRSADDPEAQLTNGSCPHMVVKVDAAPEKPVDVTSSATPAVAAAPEPTLDISSSPSEAKPATKPIIPPKPKLKTSPSPLVLTFTPGQSAASHSSKSPLTFELVNTKPQPISSPPIKQIPKTPPMVIAPKFSFLKENFSLRSSSDACGPSGPKLTVQTDSVKDGPIKDSKSVSLNVVAKSGEEKKKLDAIPASKATGPPPASRSDVNSCLEGEDDTKKVDPGVGERRNSVAPPESKMDSPPALANEPQSPLECQPPRSPSIIPPADPKDKDRDTGRAKVAPSSGRACRLGSLFDTTHLNESDRNLLPKVLNERRASWAYGAHAEDNNNKVSVSQIITSFNKGEPLSIPPKPSTPLRKTFELETPALLMDKSASKLGATAAKQFLDKPDKPAFALKGQPKIPLTPPVTRRGVNLGNPRGAHPIIADLKALPRLPEDAVREQSLVKTTTGSTTKDLETTNVAHHAVPTVVKEANMNTEMPSTKTVPKSKNAQPTSAAVSEGSKSIPSSTESDSSIRNPESAKAIVSSEMNPGEPRQLERSNSLIDSSASARHKINVIQPPHLSITDVLSSLVPRLEGPATPATTTTTTTLADTLLRSGSLSSDTGCSELSSDALSDQSSSTSWDDGKTDDRSSTKGDPSSAEGSELNWKGRPRSFSVQTETIFTSQPWGRVCTGSLARALEKFNAKGNDNPPPEGFNRFRRQSTPGFKHL